MRSSGRIVFAKIAKKYIPCNFLCKMTGKTDKGGDYRTVFRRGGVIFAGVAGGGGCAKACPTTKKADAARGADARGEDAGCAKACPTAKKADAARGLTRGERARAALKLAPPPKRLTRGEEGTTRRQTPGGGGRGAEGNEKREPRRRLPGYGRGDVGGGYSMSLR